MTAVVPPPTKTRRIVRRVKRYRCTVACIVLGLLALVFLIALDSVKPGFLLWVRLIGLGAGGLAVVAGIGAVVYRFLEAPREITVPAHPLCDQRRPP